MYIKQQYYLVVCVICIHVCKANNLSVDYYKSSEHNYKFQACFLSNYSMWMSAFDVLSRLVAVNLATRSSPVSDCQSRLYLYLTSFVFAFQAYWAANRLICPRTAGSPVRC